MKFFKTKKIMKLKTTSGVATMDVMRVQKPIKAILLVKNDSANAAATFLNEVIEVKRINSKTGVQNVIYPKMTVLNCADIASGGVGFFRQFITGSSAILPISNDGLDLDNDMYLEVEVTSCVTTATVSYTAYGIEDLEITKKPFEYVKLAIPTGETVKKVTVGGNDKIALPKANFVRLTVKGKAGQSAEFLPAELSAICDMQNDVVKLASTIAYGSDVHYLMDLENAASVEVETDGLAAYTFYLMDTK